MTEEKGKKFSESEQSGRNAGVVKKAMFPGNIPHCPNEAENQDTLALRGSPGGLGSTGASSLLGRQMVSLGSPVHGKKMREELHPLRKDLCDQGVGRQTRKKESL